MRPNAPLVVLAVLALAVGCHQSDADRDLTLKERGDTATWKVLEPDPVLPATRSLTLGVTRLGCAGGETGNVVTPQVAYGSKRIVIRTDVPPLAGEFHTCQGNDTVDVTVQLDEPVGERELVDAACLEGAATTTSACMAP